MFTLGSQSSNSQAAILSELHQQHPGIVRMKALARMHVYWPDIDTDIEQTVRDCENCSQNSDPIKANTNPWVWPNHAGARVHVDFAGPFLDRMFCTPPPLQESVIFDGMISA